MAVDAFRQLSFFKSVKIGRCAEQTLGKKIHGVSECPWTETCTRRGARGLSPWLSSKGHSPEAFIAALLLLLHENKRCQFAGLGCIRRPDTAAPPLCTLCEHAMLANLIQPH